MTFWTRGETADVYDDMARLLPPQPVGLAESVVVHHSASDGACSRVKDSSWLMSLASCSSRQALSLDNLWRAKECRLMTGPLRTGAIFQKFWELYQSSDTMKRKKMFFSLESFLQSSCLIILPQRRYKKQRNSRINGLRSMAVAVLSVGCFRCSHAHDNPQHRLLWLLTCTWQSSTQRKM